MPFVAPEFIPSPNVGSQIERAIAAYFTACGIGDVTSNHVTNDNKPRVAPLNDIMAHNSVLLVPESGIEAYQVKIESEFPAIDQPNQQPGWSWQQINLWIGNVLAAMSQRNVGERDNKATADFITAAGRDLAVDYSNGSDPVQVQRALDNADMVNFTCQKVIYKGATRVAKGPDGGLYFVEQRNYEIHAVPYNSD